MSHAWEPSLQALFTWLVPQAGVVPTRDEIVAWYEQVSVLRGWHSFETAVVGLPYELRLTIGVVLAGAGLYLVVRSFRRVMRPTQAELVRRVANAAQSQELQRGAPAMNQASSRRDSAAVAPAPAISQGEPATAKPAQPPYRPLAAQAFLTADQFADGPAPWAVPLGHDLMRIGRHQENDIRLEDKTVHRYHALLHRSPDGDFLIRDLSGQAGNGVYVNGARIEQAALRAGDLVELGAVRLRFQHQRPS